MKHPTSHREGVSAPRHRREDPIAAPGEPSPEHHDAHSPPATLTALCSQQRHEGSSAIQGIAPGTKTHEMPVWDRDAERDSSTADLGALGRAENGRNTTRHTLLRPLKSVCVRITTPPEAMRW